MLFRSHLMNEEFYESLIVEYFVPKSSMKILNPYLSNDKIEFCKLSSLMSYVSEISKKIKDGLTPIVSHFFFNVVAKLGDKRLSGSILIDMGTEKFPD